MIAAVLHLDIGARAPAEARHHVRRGFAHRGDIVDLDARQLPARDFEEGRGARLLGIADHVVGLDHIREGAGLDLRGAAGDDDLGAGPLAARLADRLPRLAHGLGRHRAGVDDDGAVEPGLLGKLLRHLALEAVQPAAERDDLDAHGCRTT